MVLSLFGFPTTEPPLNIFEFFNIVFHLQYEGYCLNVICPSVCKFELNQRVLSQQLYKIDVRNFCEDFNESTLQLNFSVLIP